MKKSGVLISLIINVIPILIVLLVPAFCYSIDISPKLAMQVAERFIQDHLSVYGKWDNSEKPIITSCETIRFNDLPIAYNCIVNPIGHLLISVRKEFSPVLLYSTTSTFLPEKVLDRDSLEHWIVFEIYRRIQSLPVDNTLSQMDLQALSSNSRISRAWDQLLQDESSGPSRSNMLSIDYSVAPLLTTRWDQGEPYNQYTPSVTGQCDHAPVGCVATSFAQIMKYWAWPDAGTGNNSYSWNGQTLSANFNHVYNWSVMPDQLTQSSTNDQKDAVARLLSDIGISTGTYYTCSTSYGGFGSFPLSHYFKFKPIMQRITRDNYSGADWFDIIKKELDSNLPRPMAIGLSGHAAVIDGYQTGLTDKVHINFGWSGYSDGFYDITTDFEIGPNTYKSGGREIITHIKPDNNSSCDYSISNVSQSFGPLGGTGSLTIAASSYNCDTSATASNPSWLSLLSNSSGTGTRTIDFVVSPNDTANLREATVTIADESMKIIQYPVQNSPNAINTLQRIAVPADLQGIVYGNGSFVAVGNSIFMSADGVTWSKQYKRDDAFLYLISVTFGNGMFVAVGFSGTILTSVDGVNWVDHSLGNTDDLYGITYADNRFVAVGGGPGSVYTSSDGFNWTKRATTMQTMLNGITYGNGLFVAISCSGLITSPDGINWSNAISYKKGIGAGSTSTFGWLFANAIAYADGNFVIVGTDGLIVTSPDGVIWTERKSGTLVDLKGITYSDGMFVAVGGSGTILTSLNGVTWTGRFSGTFSDFYNVAHGSNKLVIVGGWNNQAIYQSPTLTPVLSVSPGNLNVPKDAGTTTFSVSNTGTGTMPWTAAVTSGDNWLSIISGASGTYTGTINCSFTANTSTSVRIASIRVTAANVTGSPVDVTVTQTPTATPTCDFNGDGKTDILWRNSSTGENSLWYMNGATRTGGDYLMTVADLNWTIMGTGDFNSDGKPDILWRNTSTGENSLWYMNGATRAGGDYLMTVADLNWIIMGTGDFNSDGKPDILWRNASTGENYVWYMNGATRAGGDYLMTVADLNWKIMGTGDFNSDGKTDILWRNTSTGENYVWYMNGATRTGGDYLMTVADLNWTIMGTGDFNSDGKTDILWRNSSTGENSLWYMNGATRTGGDYLMTVADLNWKIVNH